MHVPPSFFRVSVLSVLPPLRAAIWASERQQSDLIVPLPHVSLDLSENPKTPPSPLFF
ncbi:hypothetical protein DGo_PB0418 (plasmid) [Deinococcus gobiensis I-0]|uniref:Uncharacterized protein n=1 Tax=Deinococcus gobiensis (strain DSM 21396 / JCM 16679 / CGMCC 1.7299 / I-0) TaxID=745776 RepID=H8H2E0_DEIGI|nr:hypothetical protein DGo_PB0418 [Deinococcus gobiensis I-0]